MSLFRVSLIGDMKKHMISEHLQDLVSCEFLVQNGYFTKGSDRFLPTEKLEKVLEHD